MSTEHTSVLLQESLDALNIKANGVYVDATFGRGGHSQAILNQLNEQGRLFSFDKDIAAKAYADAHFADDKRFYLHQGSFAEISEVMQAHQLLGEVDGILVDLGVSSPQLDNAERGFSFMKDGPLDMRMDQGEGQTAAEWLVANDEATIAKVLFDYGEERFARKIAKAIKTTLIDTPIQSTLQLAELVANTIPKKEKGKHPATRTFQAIRIAVNRELEDLENLLAQVLDVLKVGGRFVAISFHSLEDRLVKRFVKKEARGDDIPSYIPIRNDQLQPKAKKVGKAIRASEAEVSANVRSRSAILRTMERLA